MNELEEYLRNMLVETEMESTMDNIVGDLFQEDTKTIGTDSSYIGLNTYFVFDPFPFLVFDNTCKGLSKSMIDYYKQALDDYNLHRNAYRNLKVLPSFIKDTIQCTIFSKMTRDYVNSGLGNNIAGIDVIKDFYKLKSDEVGQDFYDHVGSWHKLKNLIEANKGNRLFTPVDMITGTGYQKIRSSNVVYANGIYMQYELKTLPVMNALTKEAEKFRNESEVIKPNSSFHPKDEFEKYLGFMVATCAANSSVLNTELENVKSKKSFSTTVRGLNKHFDHDTYKHTRLNKQSSDIDYWKDTSAGQFVDYLNKNANGDDEDWKNTVDTLSHVFNRTKLDNDLEKVYNAGHFIPDVLGMESDDTRYDARKYEDPNYRKIKGVSGYDVYKHDKKIQKLEDEIDELERKIAMESDTKKINKYQKQIEDDREEIEIILQELDSEDSKGTRTKELYTKKIANAGEGEVSDAQMNKGIQFVRANDKDLMIVRKCLSNQ